MAPTSIASGTVEGGQGVDDPILLVVDGANVVGSVPDGWWRDRAGANTRLRDALVSIAHDGLPELGREPVEVILIVEGAARAVESTEGVHVVRATGSGDDAIVDVVGTQLLRTPDRRCVVVTADRRLGQRVAAFGAEVLGPRSVWGGSADRGRHASEEDRGQ